MNFFAFLAILSALPSSLHAEPARGAAELEERAAALSTARLYARAAELRREVLALRPGARAAVALAEELMAAGAYDDALDVVAEAQRGVAEGARAAARGAAPPPPPFLAAALLRLRAGLLDCRGDTREALAELSQARAAEARAVKAGAKPPPRAQQIAHALTLVQLLRKALLLDDEEGAVSGRADRTRLERDLKQASALLLKPSGPYELAQQLPKHFVPGLRASPWHAAGAFPQLAGLHSLLVASRPALAAEVADLRRRGLLEREEECIHDAVAAADGVAGRRGRWGGAWTQLQVDGDTAAQAAGAVDDDGCRAEAPAACGLLRAARRFSPAVRVLRGSYSVVAARAHLHAHCGTTNAQLKMHVGLEVPKDLHTGLGCARIRVANETRRWEAGGVLFFDDSFEHEVWNDCTGGDEATRSVFQLVFAHPDLAPLVASGAARDPFEL